MSNIVHLPVWLALIPLIAVFIAGFNLGYSVCLSRRIKGER